MAYKVPTLKCLSTKYLFTPSMHQLIVYVDVSYHTHFRSHTFWLVSTVKIACCQHWLCIW